MMVDPPEEHPEQSRRGFIKGLIVRRRQGRRVGVEARGPHSSDKNAVVFGLGGGYNSKTRG